MWIVYRYTRSAIHTASAMMKWMLLLLCVCFHGQEANGQESRKNILSSVEYEDHVEDRRGEFPYLGGGI